MSNIKYIYEETGNGRSENEQEGLSLIVFLVIVTIIKHNNLSLVYWMSFLLRISSPLANDVIKRFPY